MKLFKDENMVIYLDENMMDEIVTYLYLIYRVG
jgi:hypothetical protein